MQGSLPLPRTGTSKTCACFLIVSRGLADGLPGRFPVLRGPALGASSGAGPAFGGSICVAHADSFWGIAGKLVTNLDCGVAVGVQVTGGTAY